MLNSLKLQLTTNTTNNLQQTTLILSNYNAYSNGIGRLLINMKNTDIISWIKLSYYYTMFFTLIFFLCIFYAYLFHKWNTKYLLAGREINVMHIQYLSSTVASVSTDVETVGFFIFDNISDICILSLLLLCSIRWILRPPLFLQLTSG